MLIKMLKNEPPSIVRGSLATLPMSEYTLLEPGKKWLMRVSTNNQAMTVDCIVVSSFVDFEVEAIVCGGTSWGPRPREMIASDQEIREHERWRNILTRNGSLKYLTQWKKKMFTPPDPRFAIVPRGIDQLVVVILNRGVPPIERVPSPEGSKIVAAAISHAIDLPGDFQGGDPAIRRVPSWNPSDRQIEEYLEQIRHSHAIATIVS